MDLCDDDVIRELPETWEGVGEEEGMYEELVERLRELSAERAERKKRVERLRGMRRCLEVFDGVEVVQENLVTREGEVETELSRMRVLLARVGGRVAMLGEDRGEGSGDRRGEEMDVDMGEGKVGELVERF